MGRSIGTVPPHDETAGLYRKPITWFLVADGMRAQVFVRASTTSHIPMSGRSKHRHYEERTIPELVEVDGMCWEAHQPSEYELGNHQLGRTFESASPTRHIVEPHTDLRENLKMRFMRTIARHLMMASQDKLFDRLVLIAPPKMLGELKKQLDAQVLSHVVAELPKEMTHYTGHDLSAQLKEKL